MEKVALIRQKDIHIKSDQFIVSVIHPIVFTKYMFIICKLQVAMTTRHKTIYVTHDSSKAYTTKTYIKLISLSYVTSWLGYLTIPLQIIQINCR